MSGRLVILFSVSLLLISTPGMVTSAADDHIPKKYLPIYRELENQLTLTENTLNGKQTQSSKTTFAIELLVADGQRGEILLSERARVGTILTLDGVKVLGITGVSFSIPYPLLSAKSSRYQEYQRFYKEMITEAKKRGFKVMVELGSFFPEPEFSPIRHDYSKETLQTIETGLINMGKVITDYGPDYLSLPAEPDTFERNVGIKMSDGDWGTMIEKIAGELNGKHTKIGAGAGTWSPKMGFLENIEKSKV